MRFLNWLPSGAWTVLAVLSILLAFGAHTLAVDAAIAAVTTRGTQTLHGAADRVVMARLVQHRLLDLERRTRWLLAFSEPDLISLDERAAYDKARALLQGAATELRSSLADPAAQELLLLLDQLLEQERLIHDQVSRMLSGGARLTLDEAFAGLQSLGQQLSAAASGRLAHVIEDLQRVSGMQRERLKERAVLWGFVPVMILGVAWQVRRKALSALLRQVCDDAGGSLHPPAALATTPELKAVADRIVCVNRRHREQREADRRTVAGLLRALKRPSAAISECTGQLATESAGELNATQEALVTQTVAASAALCRMLGDFERYAGMSDEAGSAPAIITNVDMRGLLDGVIAGHRAEAEQRGLRLQASLEAVTVVGDARRLRAMADALVSNAVRFSPDGGEVNVILRIVGTRMKLEIEDDGPGIDDDERQRVFEPFFVGKAALGSDRADRYASGLGLATVREAVGFHHGEIEIGEPRYPKRGARLRVQLPLQAHAPVDG